MCLEPVHTLPFLRELSLGTTSLPRAPPLIMDDEWLKSIFGSSSGDGSAPGWVPRRARLVMVGAPTPSPLPRGGEPLQGPSPMLTAEDDIDDVLRHARECNAIRREFLRKATDAMSQLDGELADADACRSRRWPSVLRATSVIFTMRRPKHLLWPRERPALEPSKRLKRQTDYVRSRRSERGSSKPGAIPWSTKWSYAKLPWHC